MRRGLDNLRVYRLAVRLEKFMYKVIDSKFPDDEKYRSCDQLKRSSSSVAANIAESYGKYSYGAKINHLFIARGEIEETRSGVDRTFEKGFITKEMSIFICDKYTELIKQLNSYINFLKNQNNKCKETSN